MHKWFMLSILIACVGYADQSLLPLDGGEVDIMREGTKLWNDKDYLATEWPSELRGQIFVRTPRKTANIKVLMEGYLLVVTPSYGQRGGFSEEHTLSETGFSRAEIGTFLPFKGAGKDGDTCYVFQKKVEPGDTYIRKYEYGITLWREEPLPLVKNKELVDSKVASRVTPPNPPNEGILFVDHSDNNRSGHLGHALVEYEDGKILAFYPNCSDDKRGHSAVGWMEFKRSVNGGKTWGSPRVLPFSKKIFDKGEGRTVMAEKAVVTDQGEIVLFYLICDISKTALWQPYWIPLYSKSTDEGRTWSDPKPVCSTRGRIYDAVYRDGEIRVLHFANDATKSWTGTTEDHIYEFYVSNDGGDTFYRRSVLPLNTENRGYGSLGFLEGDKMIAYVYNRTDEYNLDYITSTDGGRTWSEANTAYFSRKIRNPQFIAFDGKYYMHGRSGAYGEGKGHMILYMSEDGMNWDDGVYLRMRDYGAGAYSNSIIIHDKTKNRILIQASHAYKDNLTNVLHWWME